MKRFRLYAAFGCTGCQHTDEIEFSDEELSELTPEALEQQLEEALRTLEQNYLDSWYEEI